MTSYCSDLGCRLPNPINAKPNYVDLIIKAVAKYESMTNRKDMIYDEMFLDMLDTYADAPRDSSEAAILDWLVLSRYTGPRAIEWCQKNLTEYERIDHPYWRDKADSYAFIAADFVFLNRHKQPILDLANATIDDVYYVQIRWRKQKNNDNGQIIPYVRTASLRFCPVLAAFRIRQRALRLEVEADHPIAIFAPRTSRGLARLPPGRRYLFITRRMVEQVIHASAERTFNLSPAECKKRWSIHSPRITACNLLHRQNLPDSYIQQRLRWRSLAFRDYLRNTIYSAARHSEALQISEDNLPVLDDPTTGETIPHTRPPEEIVQILASPAA